MLVQTHQKNNNIQIRFMADRSKMSEKDVLCRDFAKSGHCRFEGNCRFKHPSDSKKGGADSKSGDKRTSSGIDTLCKDYARGHCEYGARCRFKHPVACKDFLQGNCSYMNCKFFHPSGAMGNGGPPSGHPGGMKRPLDYDGIPPEICRDYVEAGVCRRPRCSFLHEMPPKRRSMGGPPGYGGPGPQGPPVPAGVWNDGPGASVGGGGGPTIVTPEMKAYVSQLELKLTHYEDKIRDLEKRCVQYEDFNKLLTERNEELKHKLGLGGGGARSGGYSGGTGGGSGGYSSGTGGGAAVYPGGNGGGSAGYQGGSTGGSAGYQGGSTGGSAGYQGGSGGASGGYSESNGRSGRGGGGYY